MMSGRYTIPLSGLKEGRHTIDFEIDNEFFELFEESEIKEGRLIANIEMDKLSSHLDLVIRISGSVKVCCDRCLEMFFHPIVCENRLLVKYGKTIEDIDPDILSLPVGENELDLQQHIYEFIMLALPIKRVHPDDKNGKSTCDPDMLKKLEELIVDKEPEPDPRWNDLKKLMNDN
jgi:uncharacterized metal-binding protein YceD (DUF177 family)